MTYFSYLDQDSDITDITFNDRSRLGPLDKASQQIMRGKGQFSFAEREIMAAFVSGLNACSFCHGSHAAVAKQFGIAPEVIERLVDDVNSAPIAEKLKPIYHYLRKLTLTPSKLTAKDVQQVITAGWSEDALHEAILIGCLFNFYNRLLDGHGVKGDREIYQLGGEHLSKNGYGVPWFIAWIKDPIKRRKMKKLSQMRSVNHTF